MNLVNRGIWAAVTGSFLAFPAAFGLSAKEKKNAMRTQNERKSNSTYRRDGNDHGRL